MHHILVYVGAVWLASAATVIIGLWLAANRGHAAEDRSWAHAEAMSADTMALSAEVTTTDLRRWEDEGGRHV